jgi:hypothetical protein
MPESNHGSWTDVVAKVNGSPAFRQRLVENPAGVLKECGLELPEGGLAQLNTLLTTKPDSELSEADLQAIAGGHMVC